MVAAAGTICLTVLGLVLQLEIRDQNRAFDPTRQLQYANVVAAQWIADHTATTAIVMARQMDVVHHYSHRKVVWFAALSDPQLLMEGIRRLKVDYIVATNTSTYYTPYERVCVDALLKTYPDSLRVVDQDARFRIVQVVDEAKRESGAHRTLAEASLDPS
jgi:hypothetical protein